MSRGISTAFALHLRCAFKKFPLFFQQAVVVWLQSLSQRRSVAGLCCFHRCLHLALYVFIYLKCMLIETKQQTKIKMVECKLYWSYLLVGDASQDEMVITMTDEGEEMDQAMEDADLNNHHSNQEGTAGQYQ